MSAYSENDISAAVADLSEMLVNDGRISVTDSDGLAKAAVDAEAMIINELVRQGVALIEATNAVEAAAMRSARSTDLSKKLVDASMNNRHMPANSAADGDANDGDADDGLPENAVDDDIVSAANSSSMPTDQREPEAEAARAPRTAGSRSTARTRAAGGFENTERAQRLGERIGYTVEMKKVSEVFRSITPDMGVFNFEVPVITWNKPHPGVPKVDPAYNMDVQALFTVLYAIADGKSTAIVGPHGCGKTKLVEQVGARLNMPVVVIPMDGSMSRSHLFGQEKIRSTPDGTESYYQYGILPMALEEPGIILFDEFDRADESVQYACHSVYEQTHLALMEHDGRRIPLHQYNRVFGTSNTKGRGSDDGMYLGSNEMSEATRDRWSLWLEMDYQSVEDDIAVLNAKTEGVAMEHLKVIARLANAIREAFKQSRISQTCSMRQQLETAQKAAFLFKVLRPTTPQGAADCLRVAIETVIIGRANDQDKGAIQEAMLTIDANLDVSRELAIF